MPPYTVETAQTELKAVRSRTPSDARLSGLFRTYSEIKETSTSSPRLFKNCTTDLTGLWREVSLLAASLKRDIGTVADVIAGLAVALAEFQREEELMFAIEIDEGDGDGDTQNHTEETLRSAEETKAKLESKYASASKLQGSLENDLLGPHPAEEGLTDTGKTFGHS